MMDGKNHILYDVIILKRLDYKSHASGGVDGKMPVMHARIRMGGKTANDLIYLFRILRKHVSFRLFERISADTLKAFSLSPM